MYKKIRESMVSGSAAFRAQNRNAKNVERLVRKYSTATEKSFIALEENSNKLKISFLGGLDDVGDKNMAVIEYQNDAIILDCGNQLGIDLPGVNYAINDTSYLQTIKHKIKAYVITHGHLDHMGGLRHIVPRYPARIYGSGYTLSIIEKTFQENTGLDADFEPQMVKVNIDNHESLQIGIFKVEFIRVTHAIPDPAAVCISTPVGRILATGDFRLDPEPLDRLPVDKDRLRQLGNQGVLLLLSDSSYADIEGRTPTEHTLQKSFYDLIGAAEGRIFVAVFSSNINRIQMIINAAAQSGRKVALDGRSMLAYAEIAVRQGILKVPKGTIVSMSQVANLPANRVLVMCTGGQGEPSAALQRMSEGQHKYINLSCGDTVLISSSPIPGNEVSYDQLSNRLSQKGVRLFRHPTHQIDGCGPLHVSGHAKRDELSEMIRLVRPRFFVPVHAGVLRRTYHGELAVKQGVPSANVLLPKNGDSLLLTANTVEFGSQVPTGSLLVDQTGSVVSGLVVKDRLLLGQEGIVTIVLTLDKTSGQILSSPDIISRGHIAMKDNIELVQLLRGQIKKVVALRYGRVDLDHFKSEVRDLVVRFLYDKTGRSPMVIPVVNAVSANSRSDNRSFTAVN